MDELIGPALKVILSTGIVGALAVIEFVIIIKLAMMLFKSWEDRIKAGRQIITIATNNEQVIRLFADVNQDLVDRSATLAEAIKVNNDLKTRELVLKEAQVQVGRRSRDLGT